MSDFMTEYRRWCAYPQMDPALKEELDSMAGDEKAMEGAFYAPLAFGTAGLRGTMGAGIAHMNIYTVAQATAGLAEWMLSQGEPSKKKRCAIAYDSRIHSAKFAEIAARVLAARGIEVLLFDELRPTPELSFIIRKKQLDAGINITASHNPKEYNGYKAYGPDGAQLGDAACAAVSEAAGKTDMFAVEMADFSQAREAGLITTLSTETDELFYEEILSRAIHPDAIREAGEDFRVVYTPFHGAGYREVPEILRRMGMKHLVCVPEQMITDGAFPTVKSPNPENKEGFTMAIDLANREKIDLIFGTDPDADRLGSMVRNEKGEFVGISGNQMGVLLLEYIIASLREKKELPEKAVAITSIVSTRMTAAVAKANGVVMDDCFTGFRFIAERMNAFLAEGYRFLMAFEESSGYLHGDYARDKDAVGTAAMVMEMAAYYHKQGKNLLQVLEECYRKYGFFAEKTLNLVLPGLDGLKKMKELMDSLRAEPPKEFAGRQVLSVTDHKKGMTVSAAGEEVLPAHLIGSNVLAFALEGGARVTVRPSGTEPKVKVYISVRADSMPAAEETLAQLEEVCGKLI